MTDENDPVDIHAGTPLLDESELALPDGFEMFCYVNGWEKLSPSEAEHRKEVESLLPSVDDPEEVRIARMANLLPACNAAKWLVGEQQPQWVKDLHQRQIVAKVEEMLKKFPPEDVQQPD